MNDKDELRKQMAILRDKLGDIEAEEKVAENKPFVGRYFKYRNSYGSDEKWWLYRVVKKITENGSLMSFDFQTDTSGILDVKPNNFIAWHDSQWIEIELKEFLKEWTNAIENVDAVLNELLEGSNHD